ncbi:unnamed protein product [Diamesa tonsa]
MILLQLKRVFMLLVLCSFFMLKINAQTQSQAELAEIRRILFPPQKDPRYELHAKALENRIVDVLEQIQKENNMDQEPTESGGKRSIATLAKNGQLPSPQPDVEMGASSDDENGHKRNVAAMARMGGLNGKRGIQSVMRQQTGKRNIASMSRNGLVLLPASGKRNLASIKGKRNVGTLARDSILPRINSNQLFLTATKRNIQAIKSHGKKREVDNKVLEWFNDVISEYDDDLESVSDMDDISMPRINTDGKRFLGRILLPTRKTAATRRRL